MSAQRHSPHPQRASGPYSLKPRQPKRTRVKPADRKAPPKEETCADDRYASAPPRLVSNYSSSKTEWETKEIWPLLDKRGEFYYTKLIMQRGDDLYVARTKRRSEQDLTANWWKTVHIELRPIPADLIWPISKQYTAAPTPIPSDCYETRVALVSHDRSKTPELGRLMLLHHLKVSESLMTRPHPNIAEYRGAFTLGDRITSLCFKKYEETLVTRIREGKKPLDIEKCLAGIEKGIKHIHQLDIVHNNISPDNVMLDSEDTPVIIDFKGSGLHGEVHGHKRAKLLWQDENYNPLWSFKRNDLSGLKRIREWIYNPNSPEWSDFTRTGYTFEAPRGH